MNTIIGTIPFGRGEARCTGAAAATGVAMNRPCPEKCTACAKPPAEFYLLGLKRMPRGPAAGGGALTANLRIRRPKCGTGLGNEAGEKPRARP